MLARVLLRAIDAQSIWTRPLGDLTHRFLHWFFHRAPALRDLLNGRWLGHPLHAVLTDAPVGILFLVIVFDVLGEPGAAIVALASASSRCWRQRSPAWPTTPTPMVARVSAPRSTRP